MKVNSTTIEQAYGSPSGAGQMSDTDCYCVGGALVMYATSKEVYPDEDPLSPEAFDTDQRWPDEMHIAQHIASMTGESFTDAEVECMMGLTANEVLCGLLNAERDDWRDITDRARLIYIEACDIIEHNDGTDFEEAWKAVDRAIDIGEGYLDHSRYVDDLSYPLEVLDDE